MVFDLYFFVAEKPSSETELVLYYTCTEIVNFDKLFKVASRSIPNSVVWFLKISHGRKASLLEEKASLLFRIKS